VNCCSAIFPPGVRWPKTRRNQPGRRRAATLTRQLLAYGRKQILQPEILDLNRVLAGMEGMFHHLMGGDVDVQIVPAPGLQNGEGGRRTD
jgi:hypothetical protein